jgi:bacterioferritin-associated ferredoxin
MYVCICNALTDRKVRDAISSGASRPVEVYDACDCAVKCGACARTVRKMIEEIVLPACCGDMIAAE